MTGFEGLCQNPRRLSTRNHQKQRRVDMKAKALLPLVLVGVLFIVACGEGDDGPTPPPDPLTFYSSLAAKMLSIDSLHVSGTIIEENGHSTTTLELDLIAPDRAKIVTSAILAEESLDFEAIVIGSDIYAKLPGFQGYFQASIDDPYFADLPDFFAVFTGVYTGVSALTYVGEETIDGVQAVQLQGTLGADVMQLLDPEGEETSATIDLWIDADADTLLRVRIVEASSGDIIDLNFSELNSAVTIEAPTDTVSIDVLDALEGGDLDPELISQIVSILPEDAQACLSSRFGESGYNALEAGTGMIGIAEGLAFAECLGSLFGEISGLEEGYMPEGPDEVMQELLGLSEEAQQCVKDALGDTAFEEELLGLSEEAQRCVKDALGDTAFEEELISSERRPSIEEMLQAGECFGEINEAIGEFELPSPEDLLSVLDQLPPGAMDCITEVLGDEVLDAIVSGEQPPSLTEALSMQECLSVLGDLPDGDEELGGAPLSGDELLQILGLIPSGAQDCLRSAWPDQSFADVLAQFPSGVSDCLREVWGEARFEEISGDQVMPGPTELIQMETCFAQAGN